MSRVDLVVDGEKRAEANMADDGAVRISFDGGETFPLRSDLMRHIVVEVREERLRVD